MTSFDTADILDQRRAYNETLASVTDRTRATWFPLALLVILALVPLLQFAGNYNYVIHLILYTACYVVMASGWNILGGFTSTLR